MTSKDDRDYVAKHEQIWNKLMEMTGKSERGCIKVAKIAAELGMDQRTIKAHLKIIEVDNAGVFLDPDEKDFCTKKGVALLAKKLGLTETADEQ